MKILVFSDTHGVTEMMEEAIRAHREHGGIDMLVHLGDGTRDFEVVTSRYRNIPTVAVSGNHEEFTASFVDCGDLNFEQKFTAGGVTFLAAHGHKLHVKSQVQFAADHAIEAGVDVLLYGHTHGKADITVDGSEGGSVRMINPGSAGHWYNASYAVLNIVDGQLVCGFGGKLLNQWKKFL